MLESGAAVCSTLDAVYGFSNTSHQTPMAPRKSVIYAQGINPRQKMKIRSDITAPINTLVSSYRALYTMKPPTIVTTAAANRAMAAVEDVEPKLGAAPVMDVVA